MKVILFLILFTRALLAQTPLLSIARVDPDPSDTNNIPFVNVQWLIPAGQSWDLYYSTNLTDWAFFDSYTNTDTNDFTSAFAIVNFDPSSTGAITQIFFKPVTNSQLSASAKVAHAPRLSLALAESSLLGAIQPTPAFSTRPRVLHAPKDPFWPCRRMRKHLPQSAVTVAPFPPEPVAPASPLTDTEIRRWVSAYKKGADKRLGKAFK